MTRTPFDAHLMIAEPGRCLDDFLEAGCDSITVHVEVEEPIEPILRRIQAAGRAAGLALRPGTPLAALEPYRELLDIVMVMTVEPGFGGQVFMRDVAEEKIPAARALLADKPWGGEVHVDGGVNRETAEIVGGLGADVLVAGTALFAKGRDAAREIRLMRALADEGYAVELNDGVLPEPRDRMVRLRQPAARRSPSCSGTRSRPRGVPVVMLRGDGTSAPTASATTTCSCPRGRGRVGRGALRRPAARPLEAGAGRAAAAGGRDPTPTARTAAAGDAGIDLTAVRAAPPARLAGRGPRRRRGRRGDRARPPRPARRRARRRRRAPPTRSRAGSSSCASTRTRTGARTSPSPTSAARCSP